MTCDRTRELISARLDGELGETDTLDLDAHLAECVHCRAHEDQLVAQRRELRLHAATELVDLDLPSPGLVGSLRAVSVLRWALFVIGGSLILLSFGDLFDVDAPDRHLLRHDAVFGTALGIGMLTVAWKPQRAIGLVPITSAIALLMAIVAAIDLAGGQATMLSEAVHVLELAGLLCLWVISGGGERLRRRSSTMLSWTRRSTVPG